MSEQKYVNLINRHEELIELKQLNNQPNSFNNKQQKHQQEHLQAGELLKSFVYAGFDGINSTLIIILSGYYSGMNALNLFHSIIAIVLSGAAGMGLADYFSQKSQTQHIANQFRRQQFQVETLLQEQKKQIVQIYKSKGYKKQESQRISELISTNKTAFVNIMMLQELSLVVSKENISVKRGLATLVSFAIYGMLTSLPYIIAVGIIKSDIHPWKSVILLSILLLISVGYGKARLLGLQPIQSIKQVLFVGFLVSIISMAIGMAFQT